MSKLNLQAFFLAVVIFWLTWTNRLHAPEPANKDRSLDTNQTIALTSVTVRSLADNQKISTDKPESFKAKAAVAKILGEKNQILGWDINQRWPIASLTKLMTAAIAAEKLPASQKIIFNDKIIATEGNAGGFRTGEVFLVFDLIKALMSVSSNDAAMALAEFYGYQEFINAMQLKAADLGMRNTTLFDPTGLSFLNQSTIADLEKLVNYVFSRYPEIFQISRQPKVIIGGNRQLLNINELAGEKNFIGGKTGFTDDANGNLISLFKDSSGETILIIVLGTDDRFGETRKLLQTTQINAD